MRARHRLTGQLFALKVIEKEKVKRLAVRHKNMQNEIMMEKNALLRLRGHPNIVHLYHTFSDDACLYYLYELVDGGEFWQELMDGTVQIGCDLGVARHYLSQILTGMQAVHDAGLVHR